MTDTGTEIVLKEHRRWTRWLQGRWTVGDGALILTNRRLIFLHRIRGSREVDAIIKKLADAPMASVLDYALTLNKSNLQVPLQSISRAGVSAFEWLPLPHFCLVVSYLEGKKPAVRTVAFQFRRPIVQVLWKPQIAVDWAWARAIQRAVRETGLPHAR